jgi:predicted P-loop ATPase
MRNTSLQAPIEGPSPVALSSHCELPQEAQEFLAAIGRHDLDRVRVRGLHWRRGAKSGDLSDAKLERWNGDGFNIYVLPARTKGGDKAEHVTEVVAVFIEWDDRPLAEQLAFNWEEFGFPAPPVQVTTGGKSLHCYWPLSEPCTDIPRWRALMKRMIAVFRSDKSVHDPARIMRLPGFRYWYSADKAKKAGVEPGSQGDVAKLEKCEPHAFTLEELETALEALDQQQAPAPQPTKVVELPRQKDFPPDTLEDIQDALACIPPRVPGSNTYEDDRRVFWGLVAAVEKAGYGRDVAIAMMENHAPEWVKEEGGSLRRHAECANGSVTAASFWHYARKHGYRREHPHRWLDARPDHTRNSIATPEAANQHQRVLEPFDPSMPTLAMYGEMQPIDNRTLMSMLRTNYGGRLRYNILEQAPQLDGKPFDFLLDHAYLRMAENGWKVSKDRACDAILAVAREDAFCPVLEYLERAAATAQPLDITRLASRFIRPEDAALREPTIYDRMMEICLIGAVRRIYEPGCQHDSATILYSAKQGKRKTTFWETLAGPDFFCGDFKDHTNKDDLLKLHRGWITEWGELDHITGKRAVGEVKHFLTIKRDLLRLPYGRDTLPYPRRGIIVGSTNKEDFMVDETGNRRFHVIPVTANKIDVESVAGGRDAIWAGAVAAYRDGRANYLSQEEEDIVDQLNLGHLQQSDWQPAISQWLAGPGALDLKAGRLTVAAVLEEAIQKPRGQWTKRDRDEVARCLRQLGLEKKQIRVDGVRVSVWG